MATMADITLFCLVNGDSISVSFEVVLPSSSTVSRLKRHVKKRKRPEFDDIAADKLMLWLVQIPKKKQGSVIALDALTCKTELGDPRTRLSELRPPDENTFIIVQRPSPAVPALVRRHSSQESLSAPLLKKARINTDGMENAIESASLTDKAVADGVYDLRPLDRKERASLVPFLGRTVAKNDPYYLLLETALAYRNTDGQEWETISAPTGTFPVAETEDLYVRQAYKDLYCEIMSTFTDHPAATYQNRIVVTGTSGIGKSAFLLYFAIRLLATSSDDNPPLIIFHTNEGSECFVYGGVSAVCCGDIRDFRSFLGLPETWYLVDSSPNPELNRAKTIISASPKTLSSEINQYQKVSKMTPQLYYMAPWDFDELERCRVTIRPFDKIDNNLMKRLFMKIGGVPRYVLQSPHAALTRDPKNIAFAESAAYYRIQQAIDNVKDPYALLQCVAQGKESLDYSSRLLHRWPTNDHTREHLRWASAHIKEEIINSLKDQAWNVLLKDLVQGGKEIAGGPLFELYVLHIFRRGGYTFETKELRKGAKPGQLIVPPSPQVRLFRESKELSALPDGLLLVPSIPNFACIDLVLAPDMLFQVTISSTHPIKKAALTNIIENILGPNWQKGPKKLRLFFVVPSQIYDDFTAQRYSTQAGAAIKTPGVLQRVEQFALKFDLDAAAAGGSPGKIDCSAAGGSPGQSTSALH